MPVSVLPALLSTSEVVDASEWPVGMVVFAFFPGFAVEVAMIIRKAEEGTSLHVCCVLLTLSRCLLLSPSLTNIINLLLYNIIYNIIYNILYSNMFSRLFQAALGWGKRRMERGWTEPVLFGLGLTQLYVCRY